MKTIILSLFVLLSFSTMNAQEIASLSTIDKEISNVQNTKVDFYQTLIAVNNFDINIKEVKTSARKTKKDFYKALMIKNGFITDNAKSIRLATSNNKKQKNTITVDTTQITGLLP